MDTFGVRQIPELRFLLKIQKIDKLLNGALDYQTQEFIVHEYPWGNSSNTIKFIKNLQAQRPGKKIALIWDGAGYHKSDEIKEFLASVNDNHKPDQWQITCILFAPNAPEQNPVEDVWLQAKNFEKKVLASLQNFFCCQVAI